MVALFVVGSGIPPSITAADRPADRNAGSAAPAPPAPLPARLNVRVSVDHVGTPLRQILSELGDKVGVPVSADWGELASAAGAGGDVPVTLRLRDVPARRAIELLLTQAQTPLMDRRSLALRPDGRGVRVVAVPTPDASAAAPTTAPAELPAPVERRYDVRRLAALGGRDGAETLARLFQETVCPDVWYENGGRDTLSVVEGGTMVVSAEPAVHAEVESLLSALSRPTRPPAAPPVAPDPPARSAVVARVDRLALPADAVSVFAYADRLAAAAGANVFVDWQAIRDRFHGDDGDDHRLVFSRWAGGRAAGRRADDVANAVAFAAVSDDRVPGYAEVVVEGVVDDDGTIVLTTPMALDSPDALVAVFQLPAAYAADEARQDELAKVLQTAISPDSWREAGGMRGSLKFFGNRLVVIQSRRDLREASRLIAERTRSAAGRPSPGGGGG